MQHSFSNIPKAEIPRSSFDRSFSYKTTFDAGKLIPFYLDEVLPGDTFNVDSSILLRVLSPLVAPVMDNLILDVQFFFVPNRLVWDNWQRFNGEQKNPGDSTDFLVPTINLGDISSFPIGSLPDYFGIPYGVEPSQSYSLVVNALPFRAYNLIYNEWYRDENLIDSAPVYTGDSEDIDIDAWNNTYQVRSRGKRHDYFTSCLPWPQKGPGVELPLGTTAPIISPGDPTDNRAFKFPVFLTSSNRTVNAAFLSSNGSTINSILPSGSLGDTGLVADLSQATAATINSLRQAFQLQRLYERDARGGTRYTEILRSHFGVISPDARLQRPEYLAGFSQPIKISSVTQMSSTDATSPQGNLTAIGVSGHTGKAFVKSFVEHGYIMGLCSVRADLSYQQGLSRMWSRRSRFEFYWPALAHLGEQAVLNKEIYAQGNEQDDAVFGYQERWAEYRYKPSMITGKLRSTAQNSLDVWHLAQKFDSLPQLNSEFINENVPMDRVLSVPSEPHFVMDCFFNQKTVRVMPVYSVPGLIDHF